MRVMRAGVLCLMLALLVYGCNCGRKPPPPDPYTKISAIKSRPTAYKGREVLIKGRVMESAGIPGIRKGVFLVSDGIDEIWVMSPLRKPFRGDKVIVKGKVKTGLKLGGRVFGIIIAEEQYKVKKGASPHLAVGVGVGLDIYGGININGIV